MTQKKNSDLYIAAIGASAGGLDSFSTFFDHAKAHPQLAYVLIQHLSPIHKSLLSELLSKHTSMQIREATNHVRLEASSIYVIPPAKVMTLEGGRLLLKDKNVKDVKQNTTVDIFFESLAADAGPRAIAVVLSGTGSDGSKGIKAIRKAGGHVVVQEPSSSKFDGMPVSSINTGYADYVLAPEKIFDAIAEIVSRPPPEAGSANITRILKEIEARTGCDFEGYKLPTVERRLQKRIEHLKLPDHDAYYELIKDPDSGEAALFLQEVLIGVTRFFRDEEAFALLEKKCLPNLINSKKDSELVKVWVTACSTGEEAYSIAMLIHELIEHSGKQLELKVFATDLNATFLARAARGQYPASIEQTVPAPYLKKYFIKQNRGYLVTPELRKLIVFSRHNLLTDPPFSKNDLVCCRNMLIYIGAELQSTILSKLVYGLRLNGFLFLGPSEQISAEKDLLTEVDRKWKLYQKTKEDQKRSFSIGLLRKRNSMNDNVKNEPAVLSVKSSGTVDLRKNEDEDFVLVLTDSRWKVIRISGTAPLAALQSAKDSDEPGQLPDLLPSALMDAVEDCIDKNRHGTERSLLKDIKIGNRGLDYSADVSTRIDSKNKDLYLISISFRLLEKDNQEQKELSEKDNRRFELLELELKETRFNLLATMEELESSNEELQTSNEELLSANEELQSSNEELQSLNEELHTLNTENQQRIKELAVLNDDFSNYFRSSEIGQLILDDRKRIRSFNPEATKLINVLEKDVDRPISDITLNFDFPEFSRHLDEAIRDNKTTEKEVRIKEETYLLRITPYLSGSDDITGIVITLINITNFKALQHIINGVFSSSPAAIIVCRETVNKRKQTTEYFTINGNNFARNLFHVEFESGILLNDVDPPTFEPLVQEMKRLEKAGDRFKTEITYKDSFFEVIGVKMPGHVALTLNDITARKQSEGQMKKTYVELFASQERLKLLNTDLEKMVKARTRELSISEERFRLISKVTNDVIVDWNLLNGSFWVSDNYYKLFGHKLEKVQDNREFWLKNIHSKDKAAVENVLSAALRNGGGMWNIEYRYKHASGSYRHILEKGFVVNDENGTAYRILQSMLDVTEIKDLKPE